MRGKARDQGAPQRGAGNCATSHNGPAADDGGPTFSAAYRPSAANSFAASVRSFAVSIARQYAP
ncbi:hypothetical protein EDD90_6016 [Streptomyces sp. Ag109_O5-1]|nr:hypothetical protein EDD90_6016 [Streptomyces sp. Ag109_O5-1]